MFPFDSGLGTKVKGYGSNDEYRETLGHNRGFEIPRGMSAEEDMKWGALFAKGLAKGAL